jgi:adenosylcobinamide-GDP ribazoletransferase
MRDPRVGTFGAVGLALDILIKLGAIMAIPDVSLLLGLALAAASGRWLILWAGIQPLARPGGMGADFSQGLTRGSLIICGILPVVLAGLAGWKGVLGLVLAGLAAVGIFRLAKDRLGGVTGDVFGLTVEVGEILVLMAMAIQR